MLKNLSCLVLASAAAISACKYPSKAQIGSIFAELTSGNYTGFFSYVEPNVEWIVEGTHPLAGTYTDRATFINDTIVFLGTLEDPNRPIKLSVVNIIGGCNEPFSAQELHAYGYGKNGELFDNNYSWNTGTFLVVPVGSTMR